jgi:hypothetical protein
MQELNSTLTKIIFTREIIEEVMFKILKRQANMGKELQGYNFLLTLLRTIQRHLKLFDNKLPQKYFM